jgi:hypothetical protein
MIEMTEEKRLPKRSLPFAATAVMLGVMLVAVVAAPANAAPRPRRRTDSAAAQHLRVVPALAGASLGATGAASSLADRVAAVVAHRRTVFKSETEPLPAATSRGLAPVRHAEDQLLRRRLAETFRPELTRAGRDADSVLDALEAATSWNSHLRELGRAPDRAARAMELLVRGILGGAFRQGDRA